MIFICLYGPCGHKADFSGHAPEKWYRERYAAQGRFRHKCSKCGAAMAPADFVLRDEKVEITEEALHCFSDCVNAAFCLGYDLYAPDCEVPGLKQKCLHVFHRELGALSVRLDDVEKRLEARPGLQLVKTAGEKSGN